MCTFNFCLSLGERGGVIIFLTFYIINISRGCIHTLVQIQNLKILHKKKINIEISIFLYLHKKDTKIQTRASLIVFPTRPHRVYWKYCWVVGYSCRVVY